MSTVILSTRVDREEAEKIDALAVELGLDRASLLKQIIRKGYRNIQTERALGAYKRGVISLSRAAEISGMSLRDILLLLPQESIELNYNFQELRRDLQNL